MPAIRGTRGIRANPTPLSAPARRLRAWASRPVPAGYNPTVDIGRLIAALVIVLFHNRTVTGTWSESATGFFALVMAYFAARAADRHPGADPARVIALRAHRLLLPFVLWCAIMVAAKAAQALATGTALVPELLEWLPPDGAFGHLWFLPFAFLATVAVQIGFRAGLPQIATPGGAVLALGIAALLSLAVLAVASRAGMPFYALVNIFYLPSVAAGVVLASLRSRGLVVLAAVAFCALGLACALFGLRGSPQLIYAAPLAAGGLLVILPAWPWTRWLAPIALNTYLVHVLVLGMVWMSVPGARGSWTGGILACLGALIIAALMSWVEQRRRRPAVADIPRA